VLDDMMWPININVTFEDPKHKRSLYSSWV